MKGDLSSTPDPSGRRAIIVVGLHRCGTSALTRVLSLSGAALPRNLMLPGDGLATDSNSRSGFWESRPLAEVDDAALLAAGSAWDDPAEPPEEWFDSPSASRLRARLARTIQREFGEAPLFIAKDPRISRLVPLWAGALADLGITPAWVISVRNPLEAAASLALRDGFSMPKGYWIWLRHFLAAERQTRGQSRAFVGFDDLLADWRGALDRVGRALALPLRTSEEIDEEIEAFLAPALRHHVASSSDLATREGVPEALRDAFDWALRASREGESETAGLDALLREALRSEAAAKSDAASRATLAEVLPVGTPGAIVEASVVRAVMEREQLADAERIERLQSRIEAIGSRLGAIAARMEKATEVQARKTDELVERVAVLSRRERRSGRMLRARLPGLLPGPVRRLLPQRWRSAAGYWAEAREIRASGLFDERDYLERSLDVAVAGYDAAYHYARFGAAEGRNPGPDFDTEFYLRRYPDVAASGINPLLHYLRCGREEGRRAKPGDPVDPATASAAEAPWVEVDRARVIAFYLPQFHPIPENDAWWGKGFTEWTSVTAARPLFAGHAQPHLPADLGYYDLRLPSVRAEQAALAREHGIHGFCYYYYWFAGRRLLERPLEEVLASGEPDFPFCLCWANENWTRRWDGEDGDVLVAQQHSPENDAAFLRDALPALLDRRYIRRHGKPVLLVYRADLLADPRATTEVWRETARAAGLPGLHLCAVWKVSDPRPLGFDALVEFPPHDFHRRNLRNGLVALDPEFSGHVFDYAAGVRAVRRREEAFLVHRGVMPRWDNTARRGSAAWIYHGSSPALYRDWLEQVLRESLSRPGREEQLVFINAWNEWAEGAFLEPSQRDGREYLEATRDAIRTATTPGPGAGRGARRPHVILIGHDACRSGAQLYLLRLLEALAAREDLKLETWLLGGGELEADFARQAPLTVLPQPREGKTTLDWFREALAALPEPPAMVLCNTVVTWEGALAGRDLGIPVLSLAHELPTTIDAEIGEVAMKKLLACARRMIVVSEFARQAISRRYGSPGDRMTVLPVGWPATPIAGEAQRHAAREAVRQRRGVPGDGFLVLGCGAIHPRKGPDLFVQVAREALSRAGGERLHFLWVGGPQNSTTLLEWCLHDLEACGLSGRVDFVGHVEDAGPYFDAADAFLLPSREDPFPLVNLEAMARGLPIVAFDGAGGAPEALAEGAGVVVPYLDTSEMARALVHVLEAPRHRAELARRTGARHRERYDWGRFTSDLFDLMHAEFDLPLPAKVEEPLLAARP